MIVEGLASTSALDQASHVVAQGAFADSIRRRGLDGPRGVKLLWQHMRDKPLGAIKELKYTNQGLAIKADIVEELSYGKDVAIAVKAAGGLSFSVGFYIEEADIAETPNGELYLLIIKGDLFEVSVVTFPCQEEATMMGFKSVDPLEQAAAHLARMKLLLEKL